MQIQSSVFTMHYAPNVRTRETLFQLESNLEGFQTPFTLVPLPPEAPLELPRILAKTNYNHSELVICGNNMQLKTRFDDAYTSDIGKCIAYIEGKCANLLSALPIVNGTGEGKSGFYYAGIAMNLLFGEDDGVDDPVKYINERFLRYTTDLPVVEAQFRTALTVDEKYYLNILLQNQREFMGVPNEKGSVEGLEYHDRLHAVIDINDRYAFNSRKDYYSDKESVREIAALIKQFCEKHLDEFIREGRIRYASE